MTLPAETFIVSSRERVYAPLADVRSERWLWPLIGATAIYALLVGLVLVQSWLAPPLLPQIEEIPIEIVAQPPEPPPPPPEEKKEEQKPPQPQSQPQPPPDLSPAYDAPRTGTDEKVDSAADPDKAKPPPPAGAEANPQTAKAPPPPAQDTPPAPEAAAPPLPPAPDATETAPPPKPAAQAPAPPAPAPAPAPAQGKQAPMFASLEDVVGGAIMKAQADGGKGPAKYTNIILGQILVQFRKLRASVPPTRAHSGKISFAIDGSGRLLSRYIAEESGSPELDRAAMEALAKAGPFPPQKFSSNLGLYWVFDAAE